MNPLRLLLVDDHILFRKALARLLDAQPDFQVVGEASDGAEGVEKARALRPDVVLMDLRMPVCDGLEATRQIKRELPGTRVVILTVSEDDQDFLAAIRHGADGYLVKNIRPEVLFQELRGLAKGEAPISREMVSKLLRQMTYQERSCPPVGLIETLSEREREVLALLAEGLSNEEIAGELNIAVNTVRNHVRNILEKLGVRNRVQAAVYAVRCGLAEQR
ncbi:MAG: response regulator transcription factor [Anaerolineae bacterium]|nr:response regulator transcription factor [Anaerolineae bacterium]MCX8066498.1 response regulator transcription factor [Anaerolineae bacterium]MDW7991120.1 response regulator transcription factor [Anaerolineae bacterium]